MANRTNQEQNSDAQPKLIIDKTVDVPPPFESDLASVGLRIASNDPTNGYPLIVRAHFQPQYITINAGDTEIRVFCEVLQASARLKFVGCSGELLPSTDTDANEETRISEVWETSVEEEEIADKSAGLSGSASFSLGDPGGVSVSAETNKRGTVTKKELRKEVRSKEKRQVRVVSTDHLHIGRYSDGQPLDGVIVDDFNWLRVRPNSLTDRSGVLVKLTVRETWMRFRDVTPRSGIAKLGTLLARLGNSKKHEDRFRKVAFEALLRHLVKVELQHPNDLDDATLAIHAVAVVPDGVPQGEEMRPLFPRQRLQVNAAPLEELLLADIGQTVQLLRKNGVDADAIAEIDALSGKQDLPKREDNIDDPTKNVAELVGSAALNQIVLQTTDVVEKLCIETALELTKGNKTASAEMLGISRSTLYYKIRKFGLRNRHE